MSEVKNEREIIDDGLRAAGYDSDEIGARMNAVARKALIITGVKMSIKKIKAGLKQAASGEYQDYPRGCLELGVVLDAIDMIENDVQCIVEKNPF